MPKSVYSDAHEILVETLIAARKETGLFQEDVAKRLGKNQSYISNIERGQRRVDVLEFVAIARAMSVDPVELFVQVAKRLPKKFEI
jgi:transcriptional regulator with XRE-family HTH domain